MAKTVKVEGTTYVVQVSGDYENWCATLTIPKFLAKGCMREFWEQFVTPDTRFAAIPYFTMTDYYIIFEQRGGLDI